MGVVDGVNYGYDVHGAPRPFCIPQEVTYRQAMRVVLKFMKDNPAKTHKITEVLIAQALKTAFPCEDLPQKK